jgi:hypothetical protein
MPNLNKTNMILAIDNTNLSFFAVFGQKNRPCSGRMKMRQNHISAYRPIFDLGFTRFTALWFHPSLMSKLLPYPLNHFAKPHQA